MSQVLFLAVHGPAFSGKDTLCTLLSGMAKRPVTVIEARFAEPIYAMIRTRVPEANSRMTKDEKECPRAELGGISIRQMAVGIGEGARQADADVWINLWARKCLDDVVDCLLRGATHVLVLVPDMRKEGERQAFMDLPIRLSRGLYEAFPHRVDGVSIAAHVIHLRAVEAPENSQFNAATETPLEVRNCESLLINDHSKGVLNLSRELSLLIKTLPGLQGGLAKEMLNEANWIDAFDRGEWREKYDGRRS